MHARDLVELASLVVEHGHTLVEGHERIAAGGIEQYWTASKVRLDRWARTLKHFSERASRPIERRCRTWSRVRGTIEEILSGEVLTRVWTAVLCAYDRRRGTDDAEPIARSVLIGHVEARHRALLILTNAEGIAAHEQTTLNRLRRRAESWTNLLVGRLCELGDLTEFAPDPQQAREFADELTARSDDAAYRLAWPLGMASLRSAFRQALSEESPNADQNAKIAAAILACFPLELSDSAGMFRSLRILRATSLADDIEGMIAELLQPAVGVCDEQLWQ
jgi:hypothetical protein